MLLSFSKVTPFWYVWCRQRMHRHILRFAFNTQFVSVTLHLKQWVWYCSAINWCVWQSLTGMVQDVQRFRVWHLVIFLEDVGWRDLQSRVSTKMFTLLASTQCKDVCAWAMISPLPCLRCFHGGGWCPQGAPIVTREPFCGLLGTTVSGRILLFCKSLSILEPYSTLHYPH